jgi:hypothetical protein
MSLSPVAFIAPSYTDFKGRWIKFYEPGTTTAKIIYLDPAGAATAAKVQINADGFIVSAGGSIVVPYISGSYDAYIFVTEADADANDTSGAERIADGITGSASDIQTLDNTSLIAASGLSIGNKLLCDRYYDSGEFVADLLYNIVAGGAGTADGGSFFDLANGNQAQLIINGPVSIEKYGAVRGGTIDATIAIKTAAETIGNIEIPNASFLYDQNNPIVAVEGMSIKGIGNLSNIIMGGLAGKGGYPFITNTNNVNNVSIIGLNFDGQDILRNASTVDDAADLYPLNLIDLSEGDNNTIENVSLVDYWSFYNIAFIEKLGVIRISDCDKPRVVNCRFKDCGNEGVLAYNTTNGTFDQIKYNMTPTNTGIESLFTALRVSGSNAANDVTTSKDNTLSNIYVEYANGSAVDIGGVGVYVYNHVYRNVRKGLNLSVEQFAVVPTSYNDNIIIDNVTIDCNGVAGNYGLLTDTVTLIRNIKISNVSVNGCTGSGGASFQVSTATNLQCENISVNQLGGDVAFRVGGVVGQYSTAQLSKINVTHSDTVQGGLARDLNHLSLYDFTATNLEVYIQDVDSAVVSGYNGVSNTSRPFLRTSGNIDTFRISNSNFNANAAFAISHIQTLGSSTLGLLVVDNVLFSDTTNAYAISLAAVTECQQVNVSTNARLLFSSTGNVSRLVATKLAGVQSFREPIELGNGFLWIDNSGDLRISATKPTSDTGGVVVGTQT